MKRLKIGAFYSVKFYDHCIRSKEIVEASIIGKLSMDGGLFYVFTFWKTLNCDNDYNQEYMSIIKSTIINIKELK